jgi:hypothetical protein
MEPFLPGEPVTLTDAAPALGHIVDISEDGATVEVHWLRRPGLDHDVTVERASAIRRVHESEDGMM